MPFVQFRVHPGVGCARFGNSTKAYHLASEFPYFLQEEFPKLRFTPKPRQHPHKFFDPANKTQQSATGVPGGYEIFDTTGAFQDKFKEKDGTVFPQGARFRVFAYVFDDEDARHPHTVFEVTTTVADIVWTIKLDNLKSVRKTADPHPAILIDDEFKNTASANLDTSNSTLLCKRMRPNADLPNLAYLFLERQATDKSKVNGRLHVIGNEGDVVGKTPLATLWSNDWYDSACDGSVQAKVKPKPGGAFRALTGATSVADLKFLGYGTAAALNGDATEIEAMPGWVVVGCPDYVPDMGHFVSMWDVAFSRAIANIEPVPDAAVATSTVVAQTGRHKFITDKNHLDKYKKTDYMMHIHPHLCLFDDVRFVSGEAFGEPELGPPLPPVRAHNVAPPTGGPAPAPTLEAKVEHGGVLFSARAKKADLKHDKKLKDPDPTKPIAEWLKVAIFQRLRKPWNVYDKTRDFLTIKPGATVIQPHGGLETRVAGVLPRKLGRRMDYDKLAGASDRGLMYDFPHYEWHGGHLRRFHGLANSGTLCGGANSPPPAGPPAPAPVLTPDELKQLMFLDDMFWPASFADMPMLRELAFTPIQFDQFKAWQEQDSDVRMDNIWDIQLLSPGLKRSFLLAGDADKHFADFLAARARFAPAIIDMAHLGTMIGGSFLPGIEVGREGVVSTNWSLFYGATPYFPSVRFKPANADKEHTEGWLTKDLAIPWSKDFAACDEAFWPTSRPGKTTKTGTTRVHWLVDDTVVLPHLRGGAVPADEIEYVKEYWKALGFVRRVAGDKFLETEQSWH